VNRLAAAAVLALAACASAPPAPPSSVAADVCTSDAARLCPGVEPGAGRVLACLRGRPAELSSPCKLAVEPTGQAQAELAQACKAPAERLCPGASGVAALECMRRRYADLPQACQDAMWAAQEKYDQFKSICAGDLDRWCKEVPRGEGRLIACLRTRASQLSPLCREMVMP
jgi:hypothetical protein